MRVRDHFRAHGRKNVSLPASLRDEHRSFEEEARIKNLGLGGACIELFPGSTAESQLLRLDAHVLLEVTAPSLWDPLVLHGRVAWARRSAPDRPARLGLRFEHQEQGNLFALFQLLGAHAYET
ncbi:MAG: PilZ domain-containing protein [Polyangiaceae bacterium]|nr:PilZ domain-containing protein [Polyangiaceae bacterium]